MPPSNRSRWKRRLFLAVAPALVSVGTATVFSSGTSFAESSDLCVSCQTLQAGLRECQTIAAIAGC